MDQINEVKKTEEKELNMLTEIKGDSNKIESNVNEEKEESVESIDETSGNHWFAKGLTAQ